ncbi:alpha-taxilin-like [Amphibalanus amphitrite]|uniref:alpha-taxilin-like n=1 Tax=Amphibalanus amphitrite TaxID=1232801 RepID=UPI001C9243AB|nr:alpha-taxilin-like [Amphibalanus amphitrite]XP_043225803.1 alpha-taxilin-like [Amphibalanus amphitrite]XP_043225804.1 alpha-taxilin-like [Amphibalanus amphitrite]XP_043225806.1 alpha-taxilin-like [Amphibalanus amphitrite]XP_043225807.1 alpha-taxilin-like [Amphibalanus amphitrite]XP_043225808.1 alpha-taxilin-like [Amphibalanus amphitrite]
MTSSADSNNGSKVLEAQVSEDGAKRDRKTQKRIEKTVEQVMSAANDIADPSERLMFVCRKHAESQEENKKLNSSIRKLEQRVEQLLKEKASMESEQSKALLTRSRLEGLCRELQKQNKLVKEESVAKIREEEEKRREVSAKFQTTLSDITGTMNENNQKNNKLTEENIEMSKKLKSLCEQYEQNNSLVEKMMKQKELESQLAEARLAKLQLEMNQEKQAFLLEKQKLLQEMSTYQKRCTDLQMSEVSLREQLNTYTEKYEDFQGALAKSSKVFNNFKSEMEKMQKNIRRLEKETATWRQRCEGSNRSLIKMAEQKQADDAQLLGQRRRIDTLERLCRALQARAAAGVGAEDGGGGEAEEAAEGAAAVPERAINGQGDCAESAVSSSEERPDTTPADSPAVSCCQDAAVDSTSGVTGSGDTSPGESTTPEPSAPAPTPSGAPAEAEPVSL